MVPSRDNPPHVVPTIGEEVPRRAWLRFVALLALFATVIAVSFLTDLRERISPDEIRSWLRELGLWAPVALLAAYTIRPVILFPLSPFWIASGAFFGWLEGSVWAIVGTLLGAVVSCGLARHLGRAFVENRLGERVGRWARLGPEEGFRTLFLLKLNPIVPDDLINNLAGVSRVSYGTFALATVLGTTPIIFVYTYIGTTVWEIPSPQFWVAVGILTAVTVTMLLWNRVARAWRSRTRARGGVS
jgi:uncharacterized membrane protein YdjX (TVP38/TMEM64 family)